MPHSASLAAPVPGEHTTKLLSASVSFQASEQTVSLYGGDAAIVADSAHWSDPPQITPVATADAHENLALADLAFEQSFSLEMNRQHAAARQPEEAAELVQQAYVPHEDCADPYQNDCTMIHRIAREDEEL